MAGGGDGEFGIRSSEFGIIGRRSTGNSECGMRNSESLAGGAVEIRNAECGIRNQWPAEHGEFGIRNAEFGIIGRRSTGNSEFGMRNAESVAGGAMEHTNTRALPSPLGNAVNLKRSRAVYAATSANHVIRSGGYQPPFPLDDVNLWFVMPLFKVDSLARWGRWPPKAVG